MSCNLLIGVLIYSGVVCAIQIGTNQWEDRNTIVHLFEWKWLDIARECEEFLQHKGYGAVQVSPVSENIVLPNRPWWERYQPMSYKLETRSGNEEDFLNMTRRCNRVGVRIYVDVVVNHMTGNEANASGTAGSKADPQSKLYPAVPYTTEDFHSSCPLKDFNNSVELRNCELLGLKDINQTRKNVRKIMVNFLNHLVDLGAAGFRIDAARHMWPRDLEFIYTSVKDLKTNFGFAPGSRPFIYQEVIDFGHEAVSRYEYTPLGAITEFKYGVFLGKAFRNLTKLSELSNWGPEWGLLPRSDGAVVFIDNHDTQRARDGIILTYREPKEYVKAIAFMLAHPYGRTRVMSSFVFDSKDQGPPADVDGNIISPKIKNDGTCSNEWICEHRWPQIYRMVQFRNVVRGTTVENFWYNDADQIAFSRGNKGFIAFTNGNALSGILGTNLPPGIYCDVITGYLIDGKCTAKKVVVDKTGNAALELDDDDHGVFAIHVGARL